MQALSSSRARGPLLKPELPTYRLPGRFSVRPALRTQGEKGNDHSPQINTFKNVTVMIGSDSGMVFESNRCLAFTSGDMSNCGDFLQ